MHKCRADKGFTLIEVMVAISIFAVVAAGVYRVLSAMVDTQHKVVAHSDALRDLQRSLWLISMDMNQLAMRDVRKPNNNRSPALIADDKDYLVTFTRQGLRNPLLQARSDLERVAYSIGPVPDRAGDPDEEKADRRRNKKSKNLLRHSWPALDQKDNTKETVQVLFRDVDDVKLEFLNEKGDWKDDWPDKKMDDKAHIRTLPVAIKLRIETDKYGELERIFQVGNVVHKQKVTKAGVQSGSAPQGEKP
ncbi:MAG TPA: type II secretion system minor pseudopilin GspJ [Pseudomonadales bacterium]|nr:type II secretion system minor pseudopilin GspJ [Pseudomonadales bacterium]